MYWTIPSAIHWTSALLHLITIQYAAHVLLYAVLTCSVCDRRCASGRLLEKEIIYYTVEQVLKSLVKDYKLHEAYQWWKYCIQVLSVKWPTVKVQRYGQLHVK